ncbi:MAG TPA: glycosyltransferase [Thermoleophilaceae bacterium]|nr:glycosyltransferase [Thermoleophilaceae bacterium]
MKVLHVTPELPRWPGGSGGATRQFHLLRRLAELGHEVIVVAPATEAEREDRSLERAGIRALLYERPPSRVAETLGTLARRPSLVPAAARLPVLAWQVRVFWQHLRPLALAALRDERPDVVLVEHDYAASWAADLPADIPKAVTLENLSWRYYETRARAASPARGALLRAEAWRFARHDRRQLTRFRLAIAMSDEDARCVPEVADIPVTVVANGVDTSALAALPDSDARACVLFTGTLAYPPNAEGIVWFVERAWPAVRAQHPDARLRIVGRDAPRAVRALSERPGVEVVGFVPDLRPYFEEATVAIVPVRSGGGTRLKALEAMSSGRALVSTRLGVEGIAVEPGRHVLVEDDPEAFGAAVALLLGDRTRRAELAAAARRLVEERYDWRVLGEQLASALERLSGRSEPGPVAHPGEI